MSIRTKLILLFFGIAIFTSFTSSMIIVPVAINSLTARIDDQFDSIAVIKEQSLKNFIQEKSDNLTRIAGEDTVKELIATASGSFQEAQKKALEEYFGEYIGDDNFIELFVLDSDGKIIASTDYIQEGKIQSDEPYFIEGQKNIHVDKIRFSSAIQKPSMIISIPLRGENNTPRGVLAGRVSMSRISDIMNERAGMGQTGETLLIEQSNLLASESRFVKDLQFKKYIFTEGTKNCLTGKDWFGEYNDYRNVPVVARYIWIPEYNTCLIAKIDQSEAFKPLVQIRTVIIIILIAIMIFSLVISFIITSKLVQPITMLQHAAQEIAQGKFDYTITNIGNDEIGHVGQAFNLMAKKLKESYENLEEKVKEKTKMLQELLVSVEGTNRSLEENKKAMLNILEDVEREKERSLALANDLKKFQLAVENASDHIVITDKEGIILYANPAVERITGFAPSEIIGKKAGNKELWGGLMDMPFYQLLWKTIKSDKKVFAGEVNNRRRNGEKYVALASISPVIGRDGNVSYFVGIERDVTREKEIDRMKTEFISLASHQLRTPLSAMKWFGEMLLHGDAGVLSADQKEMVDSIYTSNERMIELVNSLLNISRIESGRLMVDPKPTDAGVLVQDVVKTLKQKFDEKNQTVVVSVHEHLPLVPLDPKLIREVYTNLVTNAIKYTPKGGDIQIFVSKNDTDLVSQVTDNGYGIPKAEQERIFQKFFRAQNIVKMETEGTGLGLYLTKSVVESSGGKIWFQSDVGKGTTFFFTIPLVGMTAKKGEVGLEEKKIDNTAK